jgi:hypothetical protein
MQELVEKYVKLDPMLFHIIYCTLLELANVKLNCKYLISSTWPKSKQELVEKYIKFYPVFFHII